VGTLTLPSTGVVYVDTPVLIYSVERYPAYWPLLQPLWIAVKGGALQVVSSELALMETLVGPLKTSDTVLAAAFEALLLSSEMKLLPVTRPILREAANLRASFPALRTPDAIHAATALDAQVALLITNDRVFRRVPVLSVTLLDDLLPGASPPSP
jgi:predicted nucleic acid-binding protein